MPNCRRALALSGAILFFAFLAHVAVAPALAQPAAQKGKDEKKLDKAQQQEVQTLVKVVDQVAGGQPAMSN